MIVFCCIAFFALFCISFFLYLFMNLDTIKAKIAAVKASVSVAAITPNVIGAILDDIVEAISLPLSLSQNGVVVPGSFSASAEADSVSVKYQLITPAGSLRQSSFLIPPAADNLSGLMTPAIRNAINNEIVSLDEKVESLEQTAVTADSAGFLPLAQQRPALMDFYCKEDFSTILNMPLRLDLRVPTEANYPEDVLYTRENCIVYDVASTRFCHRKYNKIPIPNTYPQQYRTVIEFRNRWIGCEAWGELGESGAVPDAGRLYFCNRYNDIYVFARNYGYETFRFEPVGSGARAATLEDELPADDSGDIPSPIYGAQNEALLDEVSAF